MRTNLHNLAIIAHVDHGKTTLVDGLLRQSGLIRSGQMMPERAMDSFDQEKERGITILAKCTSIAWGDHRLNIIDTPGHADFGGEVERILGMVDGVLVLVDAAEGPMPQTKFVLTKALAQGLRPIVVINKVDRPDARIEEVLDEVFDLFVLLGASDEQLDFPVLYASGRDGWATTESGSTGENLSPLLDKIVEHVPPPSVKTEGPFSMLVTLLSYDPYLGRVLTGKVYQGVGQINRQVKAFRQGVASVEQARLTKLLAFRGLERVPVETVEAGDIISVAGFAKATVGDTLGDLELVDPLPSLPIDPPTLSMTFGVNTSPFAGREGQKLTSRVLRDRLWREAEGNVAIRVAESAEAEAFEVSGRGELQLGVLIETLRREGYELSISRPRVLYKTDDVTKERLEPLEEVVIDVDDEYTGGVVEKMNLRKGDMQEMKPSGSGKTRLVFICPSRGLMGYLGEFLTDTRGTGVMSRLFHGYGSYRGDIPQRTRGVLIANATGKSNAYALNGLEERGVLFIEPGVDVYEGMIVGEHSRDNDLEVNPLKSKQLTNMRASGKDEAIRLSPPRLLSLEQAMSYIGDDELMEVTPGALRLRKRFLDPNERKRQKRLTPS